MSKRMVAVITAALMMMCFVSIPVVADHHEEKITTKQVMKKAMKGGLCKKVASGEGSDEEKKQLHKMFVAMSKNKPPKGEADSWKKLTGALVKASKAAVDGDEGAGDMLKNAANCKACHNKHK